MKTIPLTQGKVALVDDDDYEKVNQFKWYAHLGGNGRWYATRQVMLRSRAEARATGLPRHTTQQMHRFIMDLDFGNPQEVDHIDRVNTLDNQRSNLRVTLTQNQQNVGLRKNNFSGFKGVTSVRGKWRAMIGVNGKTIHLGTFPTPELAAAAYDAAALEHQGEFAVTNASLGLKKSVASVVLMEAA